MARVTADEAARRLSTYMSDKTGKNRRVPPINPSIQKMIRENTVHVFNVGPWGFRESMGSFGFYFIPANEVGAPMEWERQDLPPAAPGVYIPDHWLPGKKKVKDPRTEYAAMKPLPGLMTEPMPTEIDQCTWNMQDEGRYFANELLGVGIGHSQQAAKTNLGCFIAEGKEPTEKELRAARVLLEKYMASRVLEADQAWAAGPQRAEAVIRPEIHHVCAEWLNLRDRAWLRGTDPKAQAQCEACGSNVSATAMVCKDCGFVLDVAKHKEMVAAGRFAA
jgi:hypothetical protein